MTMSHNTAARFGPRAIITQGGRAGAAGAARSAFYDAQNARPLAYRSHLARVMVMWIIH